MTADVSIAHRRWEDARIQNQNIDTQPLEDAFQEERLLTFGVEGDDQ